MLNVKKIAVTALVLLLVGIIGTIFTVGSIAETTVPETTELHEENYDDIVIQTNNAVVEVLPTSDEFTTVEFIGNSENNQKYEVKADVKEDTLSVNVKERWYKFFNFDFSIQSPKLTVYVPEKTYNSIQVETDNGRVDANGLEANDIRISSNNGRANASELDVKELHVTTNNGRIELQDIQSTHVTSEADNGQIHLENVDGELTGRTSNGKITLITEHLDRPIDFSTNNGQINIQAENEPTNAIFDVKVDNGSVKIFGNSNWDTVVGNGDNLIKLTTDNGSITVEK